MSALKRGVMNLKRKSGRSVGVIAIIAFTLSIFLISTSVAASIEGQVGDIQEELERTVVISNSDTSFDSTAFVPVELVDNISTIDGIESIQTTIEEIDRTALEAMIAESQQSGVRPDRELMRSLIVYHNGQNVNESLVGSIGEDLTLENGRMLESDDFDKLLAVIGIQHATDNEVTIGDLVDVNGTLVEVVGIISGEATRTNQTIFMPVQAMMYAYNLQGYDEVSITMEEISYVDPAIIEIQSMTDDEIIVQSGADQEGAAISQSIDSIIANSEMSAFVSLFTAIIVISLIMIIITKERTQEIGVLKAIGLKDRKIVAQFISESISIAVFGFLACVLLTMVAGPAIQSGIIGDSASTATSDSQTQRGPFAQESTSTLDVDTTFTFELEMLVQTMLATILIGAFGAGIALVSTLKMSPAEALRYE